MSKLDKASKLLVMYIETLSSIENKILESSDETYRAYVYAIITPLKDYASKMLNIHAKLDEGNLQDAVHIFKELLYFLNEAVANLPYKFCNCDNINDLDDYIFSLSILLVQHLNDIL